MFIRKSKAIWEGSIKDGKGVMEVGKGKTRFDYSFTSRFGEEQGSNPEELIGAAHAGCFSMMLAIVLGKAGITPERIETAAQVGIDKEGEGFKIKTITLSTEVQASGLSETDLRKYAAQAKDTCPVSMALASVPNIEVEARLLEPQASRA